MNKWFVSDLHFGHKNVISYCNRPYKDIDEMKEAIIKIWNETVKPEDTVYVLGDFSLSPKYSAEIVPLLNGKLILITGNHDACYPLAYGRPNKKADKMKQRYLNDGWTSIQLDTWVTLKGDRKRFGLFPIKYKVQLCHLPFAPAGHELNADKRYLDMRPEDKGQILLHGHLHCKYRKLGRMIDVGFDADLKLWSEQEIVQLIEDKRSMIPTKLTAFYASKPYDSKVD